MAIDYADPFQSAEELAKEVRSGTRHFYYCDAANRIAKATGCAIVIMPSAEDEFEGLAVVVSRVLRCDVTWPPGESFTSVEHAVFFDERLPAAKAARMIAHDLLHIWKHNPADPQLERDEKTCAISYGEEAEKAADRFSLCLLRHLSFKPPGMPPLTEEDFIHFLDTEAGWPSWLTEQEAREVIHKLYAK